MSQLGDYTILPLNIPPTPAYPKPTTHTIYLRPHAPKIPTPDDARSLFLVNVPIDSTATHLRAVFSSLIGAGKFEGCSFEHQRRYYGAGNESVLVVNKSVSANGSKKRKRGQDVSGDGGDRVKWVDLPHIWDRDLRRSGSTAVVVLVDRKSVEVALKSIRKMHKKSAKGEDTWPVWGAGVSASETVTGSQRYALHNKLSFPSPKELQINIDAFMTAFNLAEESKAREAKKARGVPDEDGFVTVTRGGRTGPSRVEDGERKRVEMEEREAKRKREMEGFYRFQSRERRKEEQGELRRKFEVDRERVRALREGKGRFVPEK